MGNRIHVQIRREIEYGDYGFNWQIDELKRLLEDSGCDIFETLNEDADMDYFLSEAFINLYSKWSNEYIDGKDDMWAPWFEIYVEL